MRPLSLAVEGFFAYRKPTRVELRDIEHFSLSGPTGSGKSSLIDAMVFALYGRVPRLGKNTIAPAISTGAERARVSFEFEVGGVEYTATRLVHRTKSGGATTKEARLESPGLDTVSGAAEVTTAVASLLRLSFEDFTRTVVLPQGDFARFLQAPPGERQDLLRGLLGLDIYGQVRDAARGREDSAAAECAVLRTRIEDLEVPDEPVIALAKGRLAEIRALSQAVPEIDAKLADLTAKKSAYMSQANSIADSIERLGMIDAPAALGEARSALSEAEAAMEALGEHIADLEERRNAKRLELEALPDLKRLDHIENLHQRLASVLEDIEKDTSKTIEAHLESAESQVAAAADRVRAAEDRFERARTEHAAHEIAGKLKSGDICPVCQNKVTTELKPETGDVKKAQDDLNHEKAEQETLREAAATVRETLSAARARAESLRLKKSELLEDLEESPFTQDEIATLRATHAAASQALLAVDEDLTRSRSNLKEKRALLENLAEGQRTLTNQLIAARDQVSDLRPGIPISDDPAIGWKEFLEWRDDKAVELADQLPIAEKEVALVEEELLVVQEEIKEQFARLLIPMEAPISAAVARAEAKATAVVESHESAIARSRDLTAQLEVASRNQLVASTLKGHLNANGFERWMMVGAIADLVGHANSVLADLSADAYSLEADDNGAFSIVDHRNADEVRPISTLSGGETFMVSLALALALAETLSAGGAGQLQSIFLDEGFGTLDGESIDIVAGVLEGLAETGLMVGIITHVGELASRAPVRFDVRKGPDGSKLDGPFS